MLPDQPGPELKDYDSKLLSAIKIQEPLCGGNVVSLEDVKQRVFVIQLKLQLLSRTVLLLPQEKPEQWLTLQRRNILEGEMITQSDREKATQSLVKKDESPSVNTSLAA